MEKTEETFDANQIYEHLKQASMRPIIRFELEKRKDISPFDMKIGGAYYLPQGEKPPINTETGKELYLLAQLDFSKMPHLQNFPQKGILQIFIAGDDDMAGMNLKKTYMNHLMMNLKSFCLFPLLPPMH